MNSQATMNWVSAVSNSYLAPVWAVSAVERALEWALDRRFEYLRLKTSEGPVVALALLQGEGRRVEPGLEAERSGDHYPPRARLR